MSEDRPSLGKDYVLLTQSICLLSLTLITTNCHHLLVLFLFSLINNISVIESKSYQIIHDFKETPFLYL